MFSDKGKPKNVSPVDIFEKKFLKDLFKLDGTN